MKKLSITTKIFGMVLCVSGIFSHVLGMQHGAELLKELESEKTLLLNRFKIGSFIHFIDSYVLARQYSRAQLEINMYDFLKPLSYVAGFTVGVATYVGLVGCFPQAQAQTPTQMYIAVGTAAVTTGTILGYHQYKTRRFTQFQKRFIEDCNKAIFTRSCPMTHDRFMVQAHERGLLSPDRHPYDNMGEHHCSWN